MTRLSSILALTAVLIPGVARAQGSTPQPVTYALESPPSAFEYGCFGPCACPVLIRAPLRGTFELRLSRTDPLYAYYDVLDVRWTAPDAANPVMITGSGTYRRGGEFALLEQLTLDLSFNGGPAWHFDSGLRPPGAPFPEIDTRISLHGEACHDSVVLVDAKPGSVAGVGGDPKAATLEVTPNPFGPSARVDFTLARDARVSLSVFDPSGRRLRALVSNEWLAAGPHRTEWDGRLDEGREATPGLYYLRLDLPAGRVARAAIKLR